MFGSRRGWLSSVCVVRRGVCVSGGVSCVVLSHKSVKSTSLSVLLCLAHSVFYHRLSDRIMHSSAHTPPLPVTVYCSEVGPSWLPRPAHTVTVYRVLYR